jgi:heptosyltransferase III
VLEVGISPLVVRTDEDRARSLCGRLSILETAEVIRRAALYVGIDSGPAHLANAVAAPAVILLGRFFGFARYRPFSGGYADGSRATLLHAAGLNADGLHADGFTAALTVDEVFAAVMARV